MLQLLTAFFTEARHDEDYDEEMQENLDGDAKSDYYLISRISDVVHHLFKVYGPALCPRFETFLNMMLKLTVGAEIPKYSSDTLTCDLAH